MVVVVVVGSGSNVVLVVLLGVVVVWQLHRSLQDAFLRGCRLHRLSVSRNSSVSGLLA